MMYGNELRAVETCGTDIRRPSVSERLEMEHKNLSERLAQVNAALEALRKNPELQNLLDLVSKVA